MSILKKAAGLFVEIDDKPKVPMKGENVESVLSNVEIQSTQPSTQEVNEFSEQFRKILEDENKRNFPGNDYYEFKAMKDAMNTIPQEDLRYRAAFAGWAVSGGMTKKQLIDTAKIYLGLVEREISNFNEAFNSQYDSVVSINEESLKAKKKELDELTARINLLQSEMSSLSENVVRHRTALSMKRDAFTKAGLNQKNEILKEIENIDKYIN